MKNITFLLGSYSDEAILGMNDLKIDFDKMLVTKGNLWIPVVDVQCNLVGRKVLVRRSVTVPKRTQVIYQAQVEGLSDKMVESSSVVMMKAENSLLGNLGVLPGKTLHTNTIEGGIPVLLYNPTDEDVS